MSSMMEQVIVMLMKGNSNDSINQMKKVKESSNALVSVLKGNPKETSLVGFSRSVKRVSCVRVRNPDSGSGQGLTKTTRKRKFAQFFSLDVQMNIRNRNKLSWSINQWWDFLQIQPKCYSSNYQTQTRVRQYKLTKTNQETRWKLQWKLFNIATTIQNLDKPARLIIRCYLQEPCKTPMAETVLIGDEIPNSVTRISNGGVGELISNDRSEMLSSD